MMPVPGPVDMFSSRDSPIVNSLLLAACSLAFVLVPVFASVKRKIRLQHHFFANNRVAVSKDPTLVTVQSSFHFVPPVQ